MIEDITLYAVWEEIPVVSMYTVTYNANGGEFNSGNTTMQEIIESGGNITSEIPRKTGYRFLGWSEDSSATTATYLTEGTYAGNSDITLYAIWEVEQYTITYDANGGTFSSGSTTMLGTVAYGARLTSAQPSRTGYTFLGWATSSSATSAEYESGATYTKDESVTLYAVWKIKTYTVAYHANGGTISKGPDTKTHGVDLTLTTVQPVRIGYTFLGWATSSSATSVEYAPGGTYTKDESVTLYAVWKVSGLAGTYSVTFNGNGGTVGTTFSNLSTVYTTTIKTGGSIPNLICIGKIGYTFKGWATSASSNTIAYKAGDTFTGTSNTTLYAIWVKNGTEIM